MKDKLKFVRKDLQSEITKISDPMQEKSKEDILNDILKNNIIDLENKEYKNIPAYINIKSEMENYVYVMSPQNISAITGKAKSRKSFLQSMIIAAAAKNGTIDNRINANLPEDKKNIILIDTEQSEYHVSKVAKRIDKLIKEHAQNLRIYSLRGIEANIIIDLIKYIIKNIKNIGMIFIDQIADLAKSINNEEEAITIVKFLEKISKEHNIHICCVIHQNKNDNYASGWLGSQIMKKSETVISVSKYDPEKYKSLIKPDYSRNIDFASFDFAVNDYGIPYILNSNSDNDPLNDVLNPDKFIESSNDINENIPF